MSMTRNLGTLLAVALLAAGCQTGGKKPTDAVTRADVSEVAAQAVAEQTPAMQEELAKFRGQVGALGKQIGAYQAADLRIADLAGKVATLETGVADFGARLDARNAALAEQLAVDKTAHDARLAELDALLRDVLERAKAFDKYKELQDRIEQRALTRELAELDYELQRLPAGRRMLDERLKTLEADKAKALARLAEIEQALAPPGGNQ